MRRGLLLLIALTAGCAPSARYVWVDDYRDATPAGQTDYVLRPGDVLAIRVHEQESMSAPRARVRTDGRISVPLINDVEVAGQTPAAVATALEGRFQEYLTHPRVTVTVEESRPFTLSVLGEVVRPGVYPVEPGSSVLHALAAAGGLSEFAQLDRVFLLRKDPADGTTQRIRFDYRQASQARGRGALFVVRPEDVLVVE